jgi:hypothetical protein
MPLTSASRLRFLGSKAGVVTGIVRLVLSLVQFIPIYQYEGVRPAKKHEYGLRSSDYAQKDFVEYCSHLKGNDIDL